MEKTTELILPLPDVEVRGVGTITNPATGEVIEIWLGAPPQSQPQSNDAEDKE